MIDDIVASDVLKFDNSYSWTRSKEIFYSVKLLPPGTKPHLHVPPAEMEVVGGESHTHNSSPSSTHSSDFYDCNANGTQVSEEELVGHTNQSGSEDTNGDQLDGEKQEGACCSDN